MHGKLAHLEEVKMYHFVNWKIKPQLEQQFSLCSTLNEWYSSPVQSTYYVHSLPSAAPKLSFIWLLLHNMLDLFFFFIIIILCFLSRFLSHSCSFRRLVKYVLCCCLFVCSLLFHFMSSWLIHLVRLYWANYGDQTKDATKYQKIST